MILRLIGMVFLTSIGGAALGGSVGWAVASFLPGYYHTVFPEMRADPVEVGVGLGVTQGLAAGFILGTIVVVVAVLKKDKIDS